MYCTEADLLKQISEAELISLTDDEASGAIVDEVVNRAIADADAEIDTYCVSRYTVPFETVPDIIRKISVDIAIYNLYARRRGAPDDRKDRYTNAIRFLEAVSKGDVSIGTTDSGDGAAVSAADGPAANASVDDRIFSIGRGGNSGSLDNY